MGLKKLNVLIIQLMISESIQTVFINPKWEIRPKVSKYPSKRWGHSAVIRKNKLYIYGGVSGKQREGVYEIDCETFECQTLDLPNFPDTRQSHSCSLVKDSLIILGGCRQQKPFDLNGFFRFKNITQPLNDCIGIKFKDKGCSWWQIPQNPLIAPRQSHSTVILKDKYIFLYGGVGQNEVQFDDYWVFNTELQTWFQIKSIVGKISHRVGCSMTLIKDKIYLFGGQNKKEEYEQQIFTLEFSQCDFTSKQRIPQIRFQQVIPINNVMPQARSYHSAVNYLDRYLIIIGGEGKISDSKGKVMKILFNDVWVFDTEQKYWSRLQISNESALKPRSCFTASLFRNKIFIFGGIINVQTFRQSEELVILSLTQSSQKNIGTCNLCKLHYKTLEKIRQQKSNEEIIIRSSLEFGLINLYKLSRKIKNPFDAFCLILEGFERLQYNSLVVNMLEGRVCIFQGSGIYVSQQKFKQIANRYQFVDEIQIKNSLIFEALQARREQQCLQIFGFNIKNACCRLGDCFLLINRRQQYMDISLTTKDNIFYAQFNVTSSTVNRKHERAYQIIRLFISKYNINVNLLQQKTFTIIVTELQKISPVQNEIRVNGKGNVEISSANKKISLQSYCSTLFLRQPAINVKVNDKQLQLRSLQYEYLGCEYDTQVQNDFEVIKLRQSQNQKSKILIYRNGVRVGKYQTNTQPNLEGYVEISMRYQLNILRNRIENSRQIDQMLRLICQEFKSNIRKRKNNTNAYQLQKSNYHV